jgi:excisionase family DNA binding protein
MKALLLYPPAEAPQLLSLSRAKLYAMLEAREARGVSIARSRRIPRSEIERFASEGVA